MIDATAKLSEFLDAVAAKQPTPGGGAVSAVAGALAAAMGEMVLNYSIGKKDLEPHRAAFTDALAHLHKARGVFVELMLEDQLAFEALTAAKKSDDESARSAALLAAIRIPQAIAATAAAVLEEARRVTPISNKWLLSDLAVCVELAMATVRAAVCNVRVNLGDVADLTEKDKLRRWGEEITARCVTIARETTPAIWKRVEA